MTNTREELLNDKLDYLYSTKQIFKSVLEEKGVEVLDSDTFREYAYKIREITNSNILIFETEQEMLEYENPKNNMLAVIYKITNDTISLVNYMQYLIFLDEATLSQECTENYNVNILDENNIIVGNAYITPASFYFNINKTVNIEVNYISTDGINYTKITSTDNPVNVINPIKLDLDADTIKWFSPFLKYENTYFGGLYRYIKDTFIYVKSEAELQLELEKIEANRLADIIRGE